VAEGKALASNPLGGAPRTPLTIERKTEKTRFARGFAESGPGYLHFPAERDAEFFRQLTAERVVTRFERGRPIRSWQAKRDGERNETLDTTIYAMAALHGLISMGLSLGEEADAMVSAGHGARCR
jgi:phage terminase large subunit GpA-like protein